MNPHSGIALGGGGGHGLFEGRYPKQNYRSPVRCYDSPLSLFQGIKGQLIDLTVVTGRIFQLSKCNFSYNSNQNTNYG